MEVKLFSGRNLLDEGLGGGEVTANASNETYDL